MKRKPLLVGIGIAVTACCLAGGIFFALLRHVPAFYAQAAVADGPERKQKANEFVSKFIRLLGDHRGQWYDTFTSEEINCYLSDGLEKKGVVLPDGVHEPRVAIEQDRIRLGFRYGKKPWSTIVTVDLRLWHKEPNLVACEFERVRAGLIPISIQSFLEKLSESARKQNIEVNYYRHDGHPVAVLRFQADRTNPTFCLQRLELRPGELFIHGKAADEVQLQGEPIAAKD
ncbi:MAG: hypothetical protein AB7K24_25800 [Gemmataceae bacterium]